AGIHVEVIEGTEEARLVQLAVSERLDLRGKSVLLVDIGGGSTELTLMPHDGSTAFSRSMPAGTVRLAEASLEGRGPIAANHRRLLDEYVDRVFGEAVPEIREQCTAGLDMLIGTGGNIETLADLCPVPGAFSEGRVIEVSAMERLLDDLSARS